MKLNKFWKKNINEINFIEKNLIFFSFTLFTILSSIVFCFYFINQFPEYFYNNSQDIIIEKIPFGYGNLLNNIFENNKYVNSETFEFYENGNFVELINIEFALKKLPFYTFFLFILLSISKNIFFLIITKNLIFFNIFYFTSYFSFKSLDLKISKFIILLIFFIFIPYNFKTFSEISFADSVSSILFSCLFLLSISKIKFKFLYLGICLFFLYLTKESMFVVCVIFPLVITLIEYKKFKKQSIIPLYFAICAIFMWGFYGINKTGSFPFGSSLSSWKSYDMSKALDKEFSNYYPKYSTDFIDTNKINKKIFNEWEFYHYYKSQNIFVIKNKPELVLKNTLLKLKFIFFNITPDGYQYKTKINADILFILSSIINKLVFYSAVFLFSFHLIFKNSKQNNYEFYYFTLVCLNLAPHVVGWATSKHLIGIYLISFIFIIIFFKKSYFFKVKNN